MKKFTVIVFKQPIESGALKGHHSYRGETFEILQDEVLLTDFGGAIVHHINKKDVESIFSCNCVGGLTTYYPNIEPLKCPENQPNLTQVPNSEETAINEESVQQNTQNGSNTP